jgi:fructokinase
LYNKIISIGEILWDIFPSGKELGGASTNFSYFVRKLGQDGLIASRVGSDEAGREILTSLQKLKIPLDYIQIDPYHPTGIVDVKVGPVGLPDYVIKENVAWDYIELNEGLKKLAGEADVIYFGTIAQRSLTSRKTISDFLKLSGENITRIFDINLRQNFYSPEIIKSSLKFSTIIKLNEKELEKLKEMMGSTCQDDDINFCRELMDKYDIKLVCITRGEKGSIIIDKDHFYQHPGYKVTVVDTVGAGDAFAAAMVVKYIEGGTLEEISEFANQIGSWVCTKKGATPLLTQEIKRLFQ